MMWKKSWPWKLQIENAKCTMYYSLYAFYVHVDYFEHYDRNVRRKKSEMIYHLCHLDNGQMFTYNGGLRSFWVQIQQLQTGSLK